jgi:hypothetical protein
MVRLMRRPACWILVPRVRLMKSLDNAYVYTCTHIDSTSGLVRRTVLRPHTSASSMLPSPLPTRMSLHHLTPPHMPHIPSLSLDVERLSSGLLQASRMGHQAGLVLSSRTPIRMYLSHPMLACRRRPLDTGSPQTFVLGMSHYGPQCAHTDDTAAPSSSGLSISSCRDTESGSYTWKQVLRPAWLMCAKTLPLAGLWVPT